MLDENGLLVLRKRYLLKNEQGEPAETPEGLFTRVARAIAQAEERYKGGERDRMAEAFYNMMAHLEFLPNSPTLMNAGRELGQLAACFVLPVEDSLDSIFDGVKLTAKIHQSGGGTGFSFSRLRPRGDIVASTMGVASGPVSFIKAFNMATEVVKQGGTRRGANMGILRIDHPDIEEFITIKKNPQELINFNLSVAVTDAFMQAFHRDEDFPLLNPRNGKEVRKVKARKLFRDVAESAWATGDPGVIFIDTVNRYNPTPHIGQMEATNPCVTKDTFIFTSAGPRQVCDLVGKATQLIVNGKTFNTDPEGFFRTGTRPVLQLQTKEGVSIKLTPDHRVLRVSSLTRFVTKTDWVEARNLSNGDKLILHNHRDFGEWPGQHTATEGYLIGLLLGDGTMKRDKAVISVWTKNRGSVSVMKKALACAATMPHRSDFKGFTSVKQGTEYRLSLIHIRRIAEALGLTAGHKTITPELEQCSSAFYRGFLRGIFDADGSVQGTQKKGVSIRLSQSDLQLLEAVQRMLLRLGIVSTIYPKRREKGLKSLPDGRGGYRDYCVREQHELVLSNDNLFRFDEEIGFSDRSKKHRLTQALSRYRRALNRERFVATVERLRDCGVEDVYDVRVPGINAFDGNGLNVHNCGEQPLLPYESCCLGSINLARLAKNGSVDWERLKELTHLGVRFLDNVIDMSRFPAHEIDAITRANRKIGLGVMGFAHLLIRTGILYDTREATAMGEEIMSFIQKESKIASRLLAESRGAFLNYKGSMWEKKNLLQRNATTTTVAPTGTLSIIAGTSSGIEPIYDIRYTRLLLGDIRVDMVDPLYEEMKDTSVQARKLFRKAYEVAPLDHLKIQSAFQKHVDNAVSKTINLPENATPETIADIYVEAHKMGLKGTTIFRDKSREYQILSCGTNQVC